MRLAALTLLVAVATSHARSSGPADAGYNTSAQQSATGAIKVVVRDEATGTPIDQANVTVEGVGFQYKTTSVTGFEGTVEVPDLRVGSYYVAVSVREVSNGDATAVQTSAFLRRVSVEAGNTTTAAFPIQRPSTVRGQVLTQQGLPVPHAEAAILGELRTFRGQPVLSPLFRPGARVTADDQGRFTFGGLVPGRYFVRVSLPNVGGPALNYVYAPGVTSIAAATPVVLESGDDVSIGITAPSVPTIAIEGTAIDEVGRPVQRAQIRLRRLDQMEAAYASATTATDEAGRFVLSPVYRGTYALQATHTGESIRVGAVELEVADQPVGPLQIRLTPGAQIDGQLLFNGAAGFALARTVVRVVPEGGDADARTLLSPWSEWRADGSFSILGVLGRNRLAVELTDNWFVEHAFLEDGTDIAASAFNFESGRTYRNVRVLATDAAAELVAKLAPGVFRAPMTVVVFPDDASLWNDSRYVKLATAAPPGNELVIKGLPPGRNYLVALWRSPAVVDGARPAKNPEPMDFETLATQAVIVFADGPGRFTVTLQAAKR
jgi:protocatechuate 3,4-dioxygenase beta subunit